ncbi:hypothetical protein HB662_13280 [Roseomonas frigidaquae]|uniref:Uncharacterized protein n=1 Tax=Falsiroseomonas frigidaquae TaxID=487318 RepID=A0ABX1F0C7_9PROT|nr:hypothetical protein [Falsiroseomonas frigidaquae]NKE45757.1 hypothetical protein [Falsiroseomonas frigidaquae]
MLLHPTGQSRPARAPDFVAASLLTSAEGAEIHLVARDGRLLRLPTDEANARQIIIGLWQALDRDR